MVELYGDDLCRHGLWPNTEGKQYLTFKNNNIKSNTYLLFSSINKSQGGSEYIFFVWSRSLQLGFDFDACGVYGDSGGEHGFSYVGDVNGVVVFLFID